MLFGLIVSAVALAQSGQAPSPALAQVKTVYLLQMRHGFDQYLANELTQRGVLAVVADPKRADAFLTDGLGEGFEQKVDDLLPVPKPVAAQETSTDKKDKGIGDVYGDVKTPPSTLNAGHGNVFLVDAHTRVVLWSTYRRPKRYAPKEMKKTADQVTSDLNRTLHPKESKEVANN